MQVCHELTGLVEAVVRRAIKRVVVRSSMYSRFFSVKERSHK